MTKEKKEWVTPEITELFLENNEGKDLYFREQTNSMSTAGPPGPS